ncbi:MAG: methylated-DNA--[protein]-cysteine S-methyltransferase [Actinomycetota bacterium]
MAADLTLGRLTVASPLGAFSIVSSPAGVLATTGGDVEELAEDLARRLSAVVSPTPDERLRTAAHELERFFAGRLRVLRSPVDLRLARTPLARSILEVTRRIPYGQLWTYGDVAAAAGRPGAARAAGSTLAHCPIEIFVPCHRVVPSGPELGSYGGAEGRRAALLRLEHAI